MSKNILIVSCCKILRYYFFSISAFFFHLCIWKITLTITVIPDLDCNVLNSSTTTTPLALQPGNKSHPIALVTSYPEIYSPPILPIYTVLSNVILPFGESGTATQLEQKMNQGLPILITGNVRSIKTLKCL